MPQARRGQVRPPRPGSRRRRHVVQLLSTIFAAIGAPLAVGQALRGRDVDALEAIAAGQLDQPKLRRIQKPMTCRRPSANTLLRAMAPVSMR